MKNEKLNKASQRLVAAVEEVVGGVGITAVIGEGYVRDPSIRATMLLMDFLDSVSSAGIHPIIPVIALGALFGTVFVDGVRRDIRNHKTS